MNHANVGFKAQLKALEAGPQTQNDIFEIEQIACVKAV
jgi:hypothetical protein